MILSSRGRFAALALVVAAAATVGAAQPVAAQAPYVPPSWAQLPTTTNAGLETLGRLEQAVQAYQLCTSTIANVDQETQIARVIDAAAGGSYTVGEMETRQNLARAAERYIVAAVGCKDPVVRAQLDTYNSQIAPRLR